MPKIQMARTAMRAMLMRTPRPASSKSVARSIWLVSAEISRPMSRKTTPFNRKTSISHTARPASRASDPMICELRRPRYKPAVTAARTPDPPRSSAGRYAAYGVRSDTVISTGTSVRRVRTIVMTQPTKSPTATPMTLTTAKRPRSPKVSTGVAASAAATATR